MLRYLDNRHADHQYEAELKAIVDGLHTMWKLVASQFEMLKAAADGATPADLDAKTASKEIDKGINALQQEIDQRVHVIISKNAPQLAELRFVLSASKIAGQFERMGDHCKNTIKRTLRARPALNADLQKTIAGIVDYVAPSITSLESILLNFDETVAARVCLSDELVDKSYKSLVLAVSDALRSNVLPNERVADVLFIAKNLERLADHATAIAREFIYIHTGDRTKNHSL
jgi:phosphate transport system protein